MQKASVSTFVGIVVVVASVIAAEYYFFEYRPRAAEAALYGSGENLPEVSNLGGDEDTTIIKCEDPEIGEFFSNAESCEEAEPPEPPED